MKQELLAPAGNLEAGYAALYYGADAVYFGLKKFSARAGADNFDAEDLDALTAYAHSLNKKVYVAINTVLQEDELPQLLEMLDMCSRYKVDAVILQDLGVARVIREQYPELELHASTQMTVHNKEGALFLQKQGFSRVVLARELTQPEIAEIVAIPNLETEAFIHGALCYSYSGLCQFSALELGRSANRGKCMYPCRSCFKTAHGDKHIFSMKDMALQNDVLKMPVTSLKIEGRKKNALYVAAVTDYYRRILDGKGADVNRAENIRQIFSRPWCKFHFNGKSKDIVDPNFVGHRGLLVGKVEKILKKSIGLTLSHGLGRYDGLQIDIPGREKPFGFSVQNLRLKQRNVFSAQKGDFVEIDLPLSTPGLKKGLSVYLASSTAVKSAYPTVKPKPAEFLNTIPICVTVKVSDKKIEARCENICAEVAGVFEKTDNPQKVEEAFRTAFAKTGGTVFALQELTISNPQSLFVPVSKMNELRRSLYEQIRPEYKKGALPPIGKNVLPSDVRWLIKTDNLTNLALLNLDDFAEIIVLINQHMKPADLKILPKNKVRLALPTVCRHPVIYQKVIDSMLSAGFKKWEAGNYWALEVLPREQIDLSFDTSLYMLNTQAIEQAREFGAGRVMLALEDTLENMEKVAVQSSLPLGVVVYQDAPLFTSVVCIRDNDCAHCTGGEKWLEVELDNQKYQALSRDCQIMLFNEAPYCIAEETQGLKVSYRRMDFCYKPYTAEEVRQICTTLLRGQNVKNRRNGNINSPCI